ncbi:hypothetical protein FDO65_13980 [Nakamurella flava]|uniref:Uncharacterized protein n=1 Tax=Nakamurella flava TaxID=2576308 RepID=A0A4U6QF28_9ACTN|nr:hypothetical protein [Nakamurella flava]TKV58632.1 hypothetical protein FDO65_13980 [Nakamurella flava]
MTGPPALPGDLWEPDPAGVAAPIPDLPTMDDEIVRDRRHEWYLVRAALVALVLIGLAVWVRLLTT